MCCEKYIDVCNIVISAIPLHDIYICIPCNVYLFDLSVAKEYCNVTHITQINKDLTLFLK